MSRNALTIQIGKKKTIWQRLSEDKWYLLFLLPLLVGLFVFSYMPMYGLVIAFQDYKIGAPFLAFDGTTEWVGFKHFMNYFQSIYFGRTIGNTLRLSLTGLFLGSWFPMVTALLLNEITIPGVKRTVQTAYYLPYFVSTAIVVSIITLMFSDTGPLALLTTVLGGTAENYLHNPDYFDVIYIGSGIWKSFGYSSIIYLAGIAGADPALYEAVVIDGGNRWHKMVHVTLPVILPTFAILTVLNVGTILGSDTEKIWLLQNTFIQERSEVIGTYIMRRGLVQSSYSFATAVGLFINVANFLLVFIANKISNKLTGWSLW